MNNGYVTISGQQTSADEEIIQNYSDGNAHVSDPWIHHAGDVILSDFSDNVSIKSKSKDLLKFGRASIGTSRATVMDLPSGVLNETYVSSNLITTISSSSASDTRQVVVEGHTISGGNLTFSTQAVTLTGQTQVTLTTALARCTRVYADDTSETDLIGNVYVYQNDTSTAGVPDTGSTVHIIVPAGENQSRKASTSISSQDYWIVTSFHCECYEKTSAFAEVRFEVKRSGGVFRPVMSLSVSSGNFNDHQFHPYFICPPNSDVRLTAVASGASVDIGGSIQGLLSIVI